MTNGGLQNVKNLENSKSGFKIQIGYHLTPFLAKKPVENGQNIIFHQFSAFFWPKWGQMLSYLNFEARFGILLSLAFFRLPFVMIFVFLFFDLCIISLRNKFVYRLKKQNFLKILFQRSF